MSLPPEAPKLPARLIDGARLLPDRYDIPALLPKGRVYCEVGVATGNWTEYVMRMASPSLTVAIDQFKLHEETQLWGVSTATLFNGLTHEAAFRARYAAELAAGTMQVIAGESDAAIAGLPDGSVDVMYIDADHRYEHVKRDLASALPKMRPDGWLIMNDYIMVDGLNATVPYGVVNATNEFMIEHDWAMQYFAFQTNMFCDVVLRPAHCLPSVHTENEQLRREVAALRSSTSWAVTRPLRAVRGLLSGAAR